MQLLAFSDPHRDTRTARELVAASAQADLIVGGGDFGDRGLGARDVLDILADTACPVVIVSGNHDRLDELRALTARHAGLHLLHGEAIDVGGLRFVGIGSAIARREPSANSEWLQENDATALLAPHDRCDVLISHTPPVGAADVHPDGSSGGSDAIRAAVLRWQPRLCLCGHVHRSHGVRVALGNTLVHNLGPSVSRHELS